MLSDNKANFSSDFVFSLSLKENSVTSFPANYKSVREIIRASKKQDALWHDDVFHHRRVEMIDGTYHKRFSIFFDTR